MALPVCGTQLSFAALISPYRNQVCGADAGHAVKYAFANADIGWCASPAIILEFRVIWEVYIEAENPKAAAQEARAMQLRVATSATIFDVSAPVAGATYRIDLVEEADRLDREELVAVRARLRLLQCEPGVPSFIQILTTALLIFVDRDDMLFKRAHRGRPRNQTTSEADSG